ncbi:MAG: 3-phosphoshikimate 1-carboxyvinyltransferase [Eubacteriales bacterium]|nr:3-phosphoshikimate 1-carboxyvinyltransferase [Eubacteriales bacterium]
MEQIALLSGMRHGSVTAPASKSHAHRLLICAALGKAAVTIDCADISKDIVATARCLYALCADVVTADGVLQVIPTAKCGKKDLLCGESGSTLRFLLPVCGALGKEAVFHREGRLPDRPLAPLDAVLRDHGMQIESRGSELYCNGQLQSGLFEIPGDVSSQYISGLLFALPLLEGDSTIRITGKTESAAYIAMTEQALQQAGIRFIHHGNEYTVSGSQQYALPPETAAEGDYSNGAFFLCMGALSDKGVCVKNLPKQTRQGDKAVIDILRRFGAEVTVKGDTIFVRGGRLHGCEIDASPIPDLIPVLSVVAAAAEGETRIYNAGRLRLKESDRLSTTAEMLAGLGGTVTELSDGLVIKGGTLHGGTVDSHNDHRIAMSAAVAACVCRESVKVLDPDCTDKSFPRFWDIFTRLERE